jgi:hypothetical protein
VTTYCGSCEVGIDFGLDDFERGMKDQLAQRS